MRSRNRMRLLGLRLESRLLVIVVVFRMLSMTWLRFVVGVCDLVR